MAKSRIKGKSAKVPVGDVPVTDLDKLTDAPRELEEPFDGLGKLTDAPREALPEIDPDQVGPVEPGVVDDPAAYEKAKAEGTIEELAEPKPRLKAHPDRSIQLTAKRALLGHSTNPVCGAFLHTERLRSGGTRKMTREAWLAELDKFTKAPR
jgi:hypothetical protein